jgi:hypothetical protein
MAEIAALSERAVVQDATAAPAAGEASQPVDSAGQMTAAPATARQQIDALLADPAFKKSYFDKRERGHAEAVAQMGRLHEALAAGNDAVSPAAASQASQPAPAVALTDRLRDPNLRGQARGCSG